MCVIPTHSGVIPGCSGIFRYCSCSFRSIPVLFHLIPAYSGLFRYIPFRSVLVFSNARFPLVINDIIILWNCRCRSYRRFLPVTFTNSVRNFLPCIIQGKYSEFFTLYHSRKGYRISDSLLLKKRFQNF